MALVAVLFAVIYHRTLLTLWTTWTTNDNYSHGPLVPLASLALVWLRRGRLAQAPIRPDTRGLVLTALACVVQLLGVRADVFALQGYSLLLMAFGLSLTFLGVPATRLLAFPLGYLVFMLTFPPVVVNTLSFKLKEITVGASTHAAEALGVVLRRSGMTLYLVTGELRIENPCSGLRSLIALVATGAIFAYFQEGGWWRRLIMLASAVPIAMAGNVIRITLLILVGHYVSVEQATGAFHDWSGYLIYAVALLGLFAVRGLLRRRTASEAS
jgi:exosortase